MHKGKVLRLKSFGFLDFFEKNYILIIILLSIIIGIIIGSFKFDSNEVLENYFNTQIEKFLQLRLNNTFNKILFTSFFNYLAVLFLIFFFGASVFGIVTVPSAMFIKGFIVGGMSAFLYSQYGLKGVAFNSVIFIPNTLAFLIVLLLASRESIKFSFKFSSLTLSRTIPQNLSYDFKDYSVKYLIFAVLTFAAAILDAVITKGFIKNFSLI